jgi:hypothetical protein
MPATPTAEALTPPATPFIIPIDVKALLNQYKLPEDTLWQVFHVQGGEIRPIYQLKTLKKGRAQIEHALLMSLESALTSGNGQFQVTTEALREKCTEQGCYDKSNFAQHLKNNAKYFRSVELDGTLVLSPDGKAELADVIETLTSKDA